MANLTTVVYSSGVVTSSGTVSTIDNMLQVAGTPSSNVLTVQPSSIPFSVAVSSLTGGTITSVTSATVNITGGTITSVTSATVNVTGGTITSLTSGTVNISGGTITSLASGTVNITGGTITSLTSGTVNVTSISSGTIATVTSLSSGTVAIGNAGTIAAVKASATAPSSTDPALVVALSPNGLNPNGTAPSSASAPMTAASDQVTIGVAIDTSKLAVGSAGSSVSVAPAFVAIGTASSGNTALVSSATAAAKRVRVIALSLTATSTLDIQFQNGNSSNVIGGPYHTNGNGWGFVLPFNPSGWFQTNSSEALNINLSAGSSVGGSLTYVLV